MKNSEKPAYPIQTDRELNYDDANGLTKREYFAAMAMQGLLASGARLNVDERSIEYADELLKQLEK